MPERELVLDEPHNSSCNVESGRRQGLGGAVCHPFFSVHSQCGPWAGGLAAVIPGLPVLARRVPPEWREDAVPGRHFLSQPCPTHIFLALSSFGLSVYPELVCMSACM